MKVEEIPISGAPGHIAVRAPDGHLQALRVCRDPRAWVTAKVWPGHSTGSMHERRRDKKEEGLRGPDPKQGPEVKERTLASYK